MLQSPKAARIKHSRAYSSSLPGPRATDDSTAKSRAAGSLSKALRLQFKAQQRSEIRAAIPCTLEQQMTAQQRIEQQRASPKP